MYPWLEASTFPPCPSLPTTHQPAFGHPARPCDAPLPPLGILLAPSSPYPFMGNFSFSRHTELAPLPTYAQPPQMNVDLDAKKGYWTYMGGQDVDEVVNCSSL